MKITATYWDLTDEFWEFVRDHAHDDVNALRLRTAGKSFDFPVDFALLQIEARQAAATKLRRTLENPRFLFPHRLSAEQSTADMVADFHARLGSQLVGRCSGSWLDMTAGLGIDAFAAARAGFDVTACELNLFAAYALEYNADIQGITNLMSVEGDSTVWLREQLKRKKHFDVIFIDPARRDTANSRTYAFADCQPDVVWLMPELLKAADHVILKASPMLDITQTIKELPRASEIFIVSLKGECKELLAVAHANAENCENRKISCLDITNDGEIQAFDCEEVDLGCQPDAFADTKELESGKLLFEPDASVMKTGAWQRLIACVPGMQKIAPDTHLFIAPAAEVDALKKLPGRMLEIVEPLGSEQLKRLKGEKLNIVCRNYGMKPDQLRKKLKTQDGSSRFLYAFRDFAAKPRHLLATRL